MLNERQISLLAKWKLIGETSCLKCGFLYFKDYGYSNYTVEDTNVHCALDRNPHLKDAQLSIPYDFHPKEGQPDNWFATKDSRCEKYFEVPSNCHLDVDGEEKPANWVDEIGMEAVLAITNHI